MKVFKCEDSDNFIKSISEHLGLFGVMTFEHDGAVYYIMTKDGHKNLLNSMKTEMEPTYRYYKEEAKQALREAQDALGESKVLREEFARVRLQLSRKERDPVSKIAKKLGKALELIEATGAIAERERARADKLEARLAKQHS